ncbi:hypothetical protein SASPL_116291 [Salvia splendens]|uniref:Phytocyanin domain-containing protein n=1 Tax=Salvia splendens TaxID=180675 RepID=A0A8X8XVE5_SALSN|nr:hypothetical protein SASPL_116291 [Salvia splendens]
MGNNLLLPITAAFLLLHCLRCSATVYTIGDSSGWDISTDIDSWSNDKTFSTGDTLLFQYSQYHSVSEVTEGNYKGCNTTNVLQSSNNGNTTFALTSPGERYFICGNRLHCLGGMKLHVHVVENQTVPGPVGAPSAQPELACLARGTGIRATTDMKKGIKALRRRYTADEKRSIDFTTRLYRATLTPLKLTVRESANGIAEGKFLMHRTKQTVLNQQMLQPANKQSINTYS